MDKPSAVVRKYVPCGAEFGRGLSSIANPVQIVSQGHFCLVHYQSSSIQWMIFKFYSFIFCIFANCDNDTLAMNRFSLWIQIENGRKIRRSYWLFALASSFEPRQYLAHSAGISWNHHESSHDSNLYKTWCNRFLTNTQRQRDQKTQRTVVTVHSASCQLPDLSGRIGKAGAVVCSWA